VTSPFDDVKKGESYFEREIFCDTLLFCYVLDIFCCVGHLLLCHVFLFCVVDTDMVMCFMYLCHV